MAPFPEATLTLDDYLKGNHVPVYASIAVERVTGNCYVLRSFNPIEPGANGVVYALGSGPEPIVVVGLPPHGGYLWGSGEGGPWPLGIKLRSSADFDGDPDIGPLSPAKLLMHALKGELGLTATVLGGQNRGRSEDDPTGHPDEDWGEPER
jgi:hypothetical protein